MFQWKVNLQFTCCVFQLHGKKFGFENDPTLVKMQTFTKALSDMLTTTKPGAELDGFPWLLKVPILKEVYIKRLNELQRLKDLAIRDPIKKYAVIISSLSHDK